MHKNPCYPTAFGIHVSCALSQSDIEIDENTPIAELDRLLRERSERGAFITWLTHRGPAAAYGAMSYINSLPGN